jgi:UDP-N-acetyl-D-mannosaminuronic acid transferase (WecB/TagA/CpsF family)
MDLTAANPDPQIAAPCRPAEAASATGADSFHRILGIAFFDGSAQAAIALMRNGGLLVVPAAPALKDLEHNHGYREALLSADLAITDSALMVLLWNRLQSIPVKRLSGLEYLRELLLEPDLRQPGNTLWIMASPASATRNLAWLAQQGITIPEDNIYIAPMYSHTPGTQSARPTACPELGEGSVSPNGASPDLSDPVLLALIDRLRPQHIVITIGGGTQERLGLYLKRNLAYRPAIHCIGAAIAFLSGDQVRIPVWADKYYLGWLLRSITEPKRYVPRYWGARKLLPLMLRHRSQLPSPEPPTLKA